MTRNELLTICRLVDPIACSSKMSETEFDVAMYAGDHMVSLRHRRDGVVWNRDAPQVEQFTEPLVLLAYLVEKSQ